MSAEKRFTTSTLVAAAGCELGTFQKWRSRNGLFPETLGAKGWNLFSIADVCVVRSVVTLIGLGVAAQTAVSAASKLRPIFENAAAGRRPPLVIIDSTADDPDPDVVIVEPSEPVGETLQRVAEHAFIALDTLFAYAHVVHKLYDLRADAVMTADETLKFLANAIAERIRPAKKATTGKGGKNQTPARRRTKSG